MSYTAHPQGIKDGLPLISIFDKDGVCVATLTMDDIAVLFEKVIGLEKALYRQRDRLDKLRKEKEDEEKPKGATD